MAGRCRVGTTPEQRAEMGLAAQLQRILAARTVQPHDTPERFWVVPDGFELPEDGGTAEKTVLEGIRRVFTRQRDLEDKQWMILRYYADGVSRESTAHYIEQEFRIDGDKAIERLQSQLRPNYRKHGPDLQRAAQDLFARFPGKRPVPTERLEVETMGSLRTLRHVTNREELKKVGFLDAEAVGVLGLQEVSFGKPG